MSTKKTRTTDEGYEVPADTKEIHSETPLGPESGEAAPEPRRKDPHTLHVPSLANTDEPTQALVGATVTDDPTPVDQPKLLPPTAADHVPPAINAQTMKDTYSQQSRNMAGMRIEKLVNENPDVAALVTELETVRKRVDELESGGPVSKKK